MKILVVEDNLILAKNIVKYLSLQGSKGEFVRMGESALERIASESFSLVLLDLNLPGIDGLEVLSKIRKDLKLSVPIIVLTSSSTNEDVVRGLQLGADDYVAKPFDYSVLLARINAVLRRDTSDKGDTVRIDDVIVDFSRKKAWKASQEVMLSSLEFELLRYFVRNPGKILSRSDIYENVWGEFESYMFSRVVDIYVGHLRKKLGKDFILTKK
ncbi:MAG: response regulator transcription factor [Patescibacteria group bacterium]